jgi:DnaJ domain
MQARNAAEGGPVPEGSPHAEHSNRDRRLRELEWTSLSSVKLPRPPSSWNERRKRNPSAAKDTFEVRAAGWRLESLEDLPAALRPDPAFRRFHPIASGLLMLDDLGNARGFTDSEAAVLRYDRAGRLAAQSGFHHKFYRLGLHPLAREFIAMSADCTLYAYDDDLRLLWCTGLADTSQIQALRRRFPTLEDQWLKNHIRCVALARDRSRYLFSALDEAWCVDWQGGVIWGLKLPLQDGWTRCGAQAGISAEVSRALALMQLALPVTPEQIIRRYRELAMRWHPDRNDSADAHQNMTALNSAVELLSGIDGRILATGGGASFNGGAVNGASFTVTLGFDERLDADWIYAADFAAHSNTIYLGSYSGRVVMIDAEGEPRRVYNVGLPPERIIDIGEFLYIQTRPALYVLRDGSHENTIDLLDGGELVMAQTGFGVLETKRLRWFGPAGNLLGTVLSADPIRRIYHCGETLVVESRRRRTTISGAPPWWR